jgi:succinate dehydrogenase/fumarate reductase flavoprotein subunit
MAETFSNPKKTVLVIGGGMGGLIAAIQAQDCGAQVILVEKSPDVNRSSTAIAGGGFSIHVKPYGEFAQTELILAFQQTSDCQCDLDLVSVFARRLAKDFAWLKDDLGLSFAPNPARKGGFLVVGRGAAIPPFLEKVAQKKGVNFQFNTTAKRLLTNEHGKVVGLEATTPNGPRQFPVDAVILATGGFEANGDMVHKYLGRQVHETAFQHRVSSTSHTGEGQLMAMEIGASFAKQSFFIHCGAEDKAWETPGVRPKNQGGPTRALLNTSRWGLWINKEGKRFIDESMESDPVSTAIMRQPGGVAALLFDSKTRERFPGEAQKYEDTVPGAILQGQTLVEIAEIIGAPAAQLEGTLREFNRSITNEMALGLEIPKGQHLPTAARIEKPPFYAVYPVWSSMNTIWGGLEIDAQARVLDGDGNAIPGLYAAGAIFGGIFSGIWAQTLSGTWTYRSNHDLLAASLQVCLVFGRVAGESATAYVRGLA